MIVIAILPYALVIWGVGMFGWGGPTVSGFGTAVSHIGSVPKPLSSRCGGATK
jgi:hypothetical protein